MAHRLEDQDAGVQPDTRVRVPLGSTVASAGAGPSGPRPSTRCGRLGRRTSMPEPLRTRRGPCGSAGRAPPCGGGGRGIEARQGHQGRQEDAVRPTIGPPAFIGRWSNGRALVSNSRDGGPIPSRPAAVPSGLPLPGAQPGDGPGGGFHGTVAQLGERWFGRPEVAGSNPAGSTGSSRGDGWSSPLLRGRSSVGRAPSSHDGGRGFEPRLLHSAPVRVRSCLRTHLVRRPDCRSGEEGSIPFGGAVPQERSLDATAPLPGR